MLKLPDRLSPRPEGRVSGGEDETEPKTWRRKELDNDPEVQEWINDPEGYEERREIDANKKQIDGLLRRNCLS